MKIKLYKSVALCSLLALAGCHDFEELNTNPYAPIYDPTVDMGHRTKRILRIERKEYQTY